MYRLRPSILLLALLGVATGNLYRPCDCGKDALETTGREASAPKPAAGCCCCAHAPEASAEGTAPAKPTDDEGCTICCKPRAPLGEAGPAVQLAPPAFQGLAALPLRATMPAPARPTPRLGAGWDRRTIDPWLFSPEGLAVFLI